MDIRTASIEDIYVDIVTVRAVILELFSKEDKRGKPRLAVFNVGQLEKKGGLSEKMLYLKALCSQRWHPSGPGFGQRRKLASALVRDYCAASYDPELHAILFNRADSKCQSCYALVAIEEATHSVIDISDGEVNIAAEETASFKGHSGYLGSTIFQALSFMGLETVVMDMNEFIHPLPQAYMLGPMEYIPNAFETALTSAAYLQIWKEKSERAKNIQGLMQHLPEISGWMLVNQYRFDIKALLREHPLLPHLSGPEIWENYCRPLLMHGKL